MGVPAARAPQAVVEQSETIGRPLLHAFSSHFRYGTQVPDHGKVSGDFEDAA
jgi:hypothetical protein